MFIDTLKSAWRALRAARGDSLEGVQPTVSAVDALLASGDHDSARTLLHQLLATEADKVGVYRRLVESYLSTQQFDDAAAECAKGLTVAPTNADLLLLTARTANWRGDPLRALECYESLAVQFPNAQGLHDFIAVQFARLGRIDEAVRAYDAAIAREPRRTSLQSDRLFVLNYADNVSPEELFDQHRRWGATLESSVAPLRTLQSNMDRGKRLRVGYLSPDLRAHTVAFFLEPLILAHSDEIEIVCFDTCSRPEDEVTERLRSRARRWLNLSKVGDEALASAIHAEDVDILVDVAGHTAGGRLSALAYKPARIQATWLGYLNTTGLTRVDYRITDGFLDPPGMTEALHTEKLIRLPHHACLKIPDMSDSWGPPELPAQRNGYPTFGAVSNWSKVSDTCKEIYASILRAIPHARLKIIGPARQTGRYVDFVLQELARFDTPEERVEVIPMSPHPEYLQMLNDIDVALDTYPYGGGTTTLYCLWMGIPVITLAGRTAFSRNAIGPLAAVALQDCVAANKAEYIDIAKRFAASPERLATLRRTLRSTVLASRLVDARRFAGDMERVYRSMWDDYCDRQHGASCLLQ